VKHEEKEQIKCLNSRFAAFIDKVGVLDHAFPEPLYQQAQPGLSTKPEVSRALAQETLKFKKKVVVILSGHRQKEKNSMRSCHSDEGGKPKVHKKK
jgi:hypothetical protein